LNGFGRVLSLLQVNSTLDTNQHAFSKESMQGASAVERCYLFEW